MAKFFKIMAWVIIAQSISAFSTQVVEHAANSCFSCGKTAEPSKHLQQCSKCHVAKYCGVSCQKDNWAQHKPQCSILKEQMSATLSPASLAHSMARKTSTYLDQSLSFDFWHRFPMDATRQGCLDKLGLRLDTAKDSAFEYNEQIIALAWLDLGLLKSFWSIIAKTLEDPSLDAQALQEIDDAYQTMLIRLTMLLGMPNNFLTSVIPKIVLPEAFIISQHDALFDTFIANRGRIGKVNLIKAMVALEMLSSLESLVDIYKKVSLSQALSKSSKNTAISQLFLSKRTITDMIEDEACTDKVGDLRELGAQDFKMLWEKYHWLTKNIN